MKVKNMPERVERRRVLAAIRAGVVGVWEGVSPVTDVLHRKGRNARAKTARKFMGPRVSR